MIQKVIFDNFKDDINDDNSAQALSLIQERYPDITSLEGLEYVYKSLKTLLGDSSADWADNKITYEQYSRPQDSEVAKEDLLPLIGISLNSSLVKKPSSNNREVSGEIRIDCRTSANDVSTGLVRQIAFRARRLLEPIRDTELNQWWANCNLYNNYSLSYFNMNFLRFDPYFGDYIGLIYQVNASFI